MTVMSRNTKTERREAGMVAIMVTMILMIVISLLVLGFAQISRRNQRQALDRQLSTQAFYAAETGVNDVARILNAAAPGTVIPAKDTCGSNGNVFYAGLTPDLPGENDVSYTCLLVDPTPDELVYDNVGSTSTVFPVVAESGSIGSIRLTWQPVQSSNPADPPAAQLCPTSTTNTFSGGSAWACGYGVLRFDLVPTVGALTLNGIQASTMSTFVVPLRPGSAGVTTADYTGGSSANKVGVACTDAQCQLTINIVPAGTRYHMRVSSVYKSAAKLFVQAFSGTNAGGTAHSLREAQMLVDSTGRAEDVLRRIQVRLPLNSGPNLLSDYTIQSAEAVCKRFSVMDGNFQSFANTVVPGVGDDATSTNNPLCD